MNRLSVRLLLSHVLVAVIGAATTYLVVRLLSPNLFESGMARMGPGGQGQGPAGMHGSTGSGAALHDTFVSAVNTSLVVGLALSLGVAVAAAALAARRTLRPLGEVRAATRRLAEGHYDERIGTPHELELAELAHDVNDLAGRLEETETRRVRLLSDVAHEMRTPLTVLQGYVEGMADGVFPAGPENLEPLAAELSRLRRLADDLSSLSRVEERRLDLRLQDLDLAEVAARTAERLRPQFADAGVELVVTGPAGTVPVSADPDRIAQVLTNLLGNALKATPRGGRVETGARVEGPAALAWVRDTGAGLTGQELEHVFERFYRAAEGRARGGTPVGRSEERPTGSGIGLTIARGIARAHGGDVVAASPGPGHGATFTLSLPVHDR